jgi:peptidoglycan/xylan/chitin deacetylase (PgdA/CDA1 family)
MSQQAVKGASAVADRLHTQHDGVVILIYHRVGRRTSLEVDLPTSLFDEQMAMLAETGRVTTLENALQWLTNTTMDAAPPIVVTFDDGTQDLAEIAMPILERYAVPATLYVATDFIDRGLDFPADGRPLSWAALADMASTGLIDVGSHTHSHALLDRLPVDMVTHEVETSIRLIEERVGKHPDHFAYPKAVPPSAPVERTIRTAFRSAALAGTRPNGRRGTDVHRLARSPVQLGDGMRWFERKVAGGMRLEDDLRRVANRWRYAGVTR